MASVALHRVGKSYPAKPDAIAEFSLDIADGELLALVGPSGCGKSTLLRMVAGLESITRGDLFIGGSRVNEQSPQQRNVAMVFQDYALYPHMTVRDNLAFPLRMRRQSGTAIARRVEAMAALLELGDVMDRLPKQLSGGQRQRVAMGRALVREPSVSLLDEPLSNLDPKLRGAVRAEIADLQRRTGVTLLYVTHDQVEAMTLGQRVAVLAEGRLWQAAPPAELYAYPENTVVAGFIGSPPMNLTPIDAAFPARLPWPADVGACLAKMASDPRAWTVGIRPEHLRLDAEAPAAFHCEIAAVEYLGHETLVYGRHPVLRTQHRDGLWIARSPGMVRARVGERAAFAVPGHALYLFDADGVLAWPCAGAAP